MVKLILKLPETSNANLLMYAAMGLADFKVKHRREFMPEAISDSDFEQYHKFWLACMEPDSSRNSLTWYEDLKAGIREYELSGDVVDVFLMETLYEVQKLFPFEMYIENRGKYESPDWLYKLDPWERSDINDDAIHTLFWQGAPA